MSAVSTLRANNAASLVSHQAVPLAFTHVTKIYGRPPAHVIAVRDVSLTVHDGEVVVILGPSGSGKTTLLSMAGCLLKPTSGKIEVMDTDVSALGERQLPLLRVRHIGFVFQSFNLLEPLNAEENVLIALNLAGTRGHAARQRARGLLDELDLGERLSRHPDELSAGERQRVAIARALANRPDVILADEPPANLDGETGRKVMTLLTAAVRRGDGRALVVVTHDNRVLDQADRVLWMEDGSIREHEAAQSADVQSASQ